MGLVVYFTNSKRSANRFFLFLSSVLTLWFICLGAGSLATGSASVAVWIRLSSAIAAFIPTAFALLFLSIVHNKDSFLQTFVQARRWIFFYALIAILCQTPFFLKSARVPPPPLIVAVPEYGPGFLIYAAYFALASLLLAIRFLRTSRELAGMDRTEMQFILLGASTGFVFGNLFLLLPVLTNNSDAVRFLPLSALVLDAFLAYGIATHQVMEVSVVLRRITAYALLTVYLIFLYIAVSAVAVWMLGFFIENPDHAARILATIAVAVSLVPANGLLQRFANRLFVNVKDMDATDTMQKANKVLSSIGTLGMLLKGFCGVIAQALGTDRIVILLANNGSYIQQFPPPEKNNTLALANDSLVIQALIKQQSPIIPEVVQRIQQSPDLTQAAREIQARQFAAAVGIFSKTEMEGVLLLGPRLSGRIYGAPEQEVLQLLCRQLAVALENAKLYTQLQDSKIYNEILLDSLISGVVAADADGRITVFNREAQRVTGLIPQHVLGKPIDILPSPLFAAMDTTLQHDIGIRDKETIIEQDGGEEIPIRIGSSIFHGHTGTTLGALVVFHDVTAIRKLELQVRRTDRLASLGTVAAGMAHEIKNPLVTIKTFTQLLPERYEDSDFRETFSSLIGQEVKRIDSIVNQLLKFSRPATPKLEPTHLHEVLDNSLKLVSQQLRQKNIQLNKTYRTDQDLVNADADQLNQAFINFLLNAIEAMDGAGQITVTAEESIGNTHLEDRWEENQENDHIRVCIQDTGKGIEESAVSHIFDPFFTTKSHGTGLGLSVAHGIIQDHGGSIDVESEVFKGTTFYLYFPLIKQEAKV